MTDIEALNEYKLYIIEQNKKYKICYTSNFKKLINEKIVYSIITNYAKEIKICINNIIKCLNLKDVKLWIICNLEYLLNFFNLIKNNYIINNNIMPPSLLYNIYFYTKKKDCCKILMVLGKNNKDVKLEKWKLYRVIENLINVKEKFNIYHNILKLNRTNKIKLIGNVYYIDKNLNKNMNSLFDLIKYT